MMISLVCLRLRADNICDGDLESDGVRSVSGVAALSRSRSLAEGAAKRFGRPPVSFLASCPSERMPTAELFGDREFF